MSSIFKRQEVRKKWKTRRLCEICAVSVRGISIPLEPKLKYLVTILWNMESVSAACLGVAVLLDLEVWPWPVNVWCFYSCCKSFLEIYRGRRWLKSTVTCQRNPLSLTAMWGIKRLSGMRALVLQILKRNENNVFGNLKNTRQSKEKRRVH